MEREKSKEKEVPKELKEKTEKKLDELRKELEELRERKRQKDLMEQQATQIAATVLEKEEAAKEIVDTTGLDDIEAHLNKIDDFLVKELGKTEQKTYTEHAEYIESEIQALEEEIIEEKGLIEKEISPYEQLLQEYPWLEEKRYEFMYSIPDKKIELSDFKSWKNEWAKVLFDYAKFAILHIIYIRKLNSEKPFSNFNNREKAIKEIAQKLIDQDLAKWLNKKKKEKLRVFWKTLDGWADELYDWALNIGKLEPIMLYEIRESDQEFSNLPKEDLEEVFKILVKNSKGIILKLDDGELSFKIKME